jgi:hypothetical protein
VAFLFICVGQEPGSDDFFAKLFLFGMHCDSITGLSLAIFLAYCMTIQSIYPWQTEDNTISAARLIGLQLASYIKRLLSTFFSWEGPWLAIRRPRTTWVVEPWPWRLPLRLLPVLSCFCLFFRVIRSNCDLCNTIKGKEVSECYRVNHIIGTLIVTEHSMALLTHLNSVQVGIDCSAIV